MNRLRIAWSLPILLLAAAALAQQAPISADSLWAGGDGRFESAPDTALVQFSISVQEPELKAAYGQAQESAEKIRQTMRANGLDPKDAEIGYFAMTPVYNWNPKRKFIGYRVNSSVTIKVRDFSRLGQLIGSFSQLDTTDSLSIGYTLENIAPAKAKAVEDAYRTARRNAEALARAGGRTLGAMTYASVDASELLPRPRPMALARSAGASSAPPPTEDFAPAKITTTAHVNVLFQLK